jgi:hypothetical protein
MFFITNIKIQPVYKSDDNNFAAFKQQHQIQVLLGIKVTKLNNFDAMLPYFDFNLYYSWT